VREAAVNKNATIHKFRGKIILTWRGDRQELWPAKCIFSEQKYYSSSYFNKAKTVLGAYQDIHLCPIFFHLYIP